MTNPEQILVPDLLPTAQKPLSACVTVHDGQVVLHLSEPRPYVAFTNLEPVVIGTQLLTGAITANDETAAKVIEMCMAIIDFAYESRGDLKPAGTAVKHELIERHRRTLTKRLEVVMNSTREKRTISNRGLSRQLVDIMLTEVFS